MHWLNNDSYAISTVGFSGTDASNNPDHFEKNAMEKEFVMRKVKELFGRNPEGSFLRWKGYPHDFGTYYELTITWNNCDEKFDTKVWNWINKVESYNWEKEEEELAMLWDIKNTDELEKDNKMLGIIETE